MSDVSPSQGPEEEPDASKEDPGTLLTRFQIKRFSIHLVTRAKSAEGDGPVAQIVDVYDEERLNAFGDLKEHIDGILADVWAKVDNTRTCAPAYWAVPETNAIRGAYQAIIENPEAFEEQATLIGGRYGKVTIRADLTEALLIVLFRAPQLEQDSIAIIKVDIKDLKNLTIGDPSSARIDPGITRNSLTDVISKAVIIPHSDSTSNSDLKVFDGKNRAIATYFLDKFLAVQTTENVDVKVHRLSGVLPLIERAGQVLTAVDHLKITEAMGARSTPLAANDVPAFIENAIGRTIPDAAKKEIVTQLDTDPERPFVLSPNELSTITEGTVSFEFSGSLQGVTISGPMALLRGIMEAQDDNATFLRINKIETPYVIDTKPKRPKGRPRKPRATKAQGRGRPAEPES